VTVVVLGGARTDLGRNVTDEVARERLREVVEETTMMDPEDVPAGIVYAVTRPAHVAANKLLIRPTDQKR
jgi:NADP-dependent 3-hydroxy acid dehydrogenase YdfG